MLSSTPRGSFSALLIHTIPDAENPQGIYARILAHRPNAGTELDPVRDVRRHGGSMRVRFSPTAELRTVLHRVFALYALVEVAVMVGFGVYILWTQYDVVYGIDGAPCPGIAAASAGLGSGSGGDDETFPDEVPCHATQPIPEPEVTGDEDNTDNRSDRAQQAGTAEAEPYQYLSRGLKTGSALFAWAQINVALNAILFCLNCAVGKYPLGAVTPPAYHFNRRVRSLRGTFKLMSMLWYGAGCFIVWKAEPTASVPLFHYCTAMLLLTAVVWALSCVLTGLVRRCPKTYLRLVEPLLRGGHMTLALSTAFSPQRELEAVLEMSFRCVVLL